MRAVGFPSVPIFAHPVEPEAPSGALLPTFPSVQ